MVLGRLHRQCNETLRRGTRRRRRFQLCHGVGRFAFVLPSPLGHVYGCRCGTATHLHRLGVVHAQNSAKQLRTVHVVHGVCSIARFFEFHERESTVLVRRHVERQRYVSNRPERQECCMQRVFRHFIVQSTHVEIASWVGGGHASFVPRLRTCQPCQSHPSEPMDDSHPSRARPWVTPRRRIGTNDKYVHKDGMVDVPYHAKKEKGMHHPKQESLLHVIDMGTGTPSIDIGPRRPT
mmetsp:Transcript_4425/g.28210  ORF Transcript_4425/g.28210 Transcript_4425/m.28210 type:complete len:236 (+) Transcript_4425:1859-2566(+)